MLSNEYLLKKCKAMLNMSDTTLYDERLTIVVGGAVNKMTNEGISNIYDEDSNEAYDYILCVTYLAALDLDLITDYNRLYTQYITRAVTLRERQLHDKQS